jgi:hypothetical protein
MVKGLPTIKMVKGLLTIKKIITYNITMYVMMISIQFNSIQFNSMVKVATKRSCYSSCNQINGCRMAFQFQKQDENIF